MGRTLSVIAVKSSRTSRCAFRAKLFFKDALVTRVAAKAEPGLPLKLEVHLRSCSPVLHAPLPIVGNTAEVVPTPRDQFRLRFWLGSVAVEGKTRIGVGALGESYV